MFDIEDIKKSIFSNEVIVCDYDGVLQSIDILWTRKLLEKRSLYEKYLDFSKLEDENGKIQIYKILNRDDYYIDRYLLKDGMELPEKLSNKFIDMYMKDDDFYKKCPFLTMARALKILSYQKTINEIHILSSLPQGFTTDKRKIEMLNHFYHDTGKIHIHLIESGIKKSDYINDNIPNYTSFIDDRGDIVKDVLENTNNENKTYILPYYKYNESFIRDFDYLTKKYYEKSTISFYNNNIV